MAILSPRSYGPARSVSVASQPSSGSFTVVMTHLSGAITTATVDAGCTQFATSAFPFHVFRRLSGVQIAPVPGASFFGHVIMAISNAGSIWALDVQRGTAASDQPQSFLLASGPPASSALLIDPMHRRLLHFLLAHGMPVVDGMATPGSEAAFLEMLPSNSRKRLSDLGSMSCVQATDAPAEVQAAPSTAAPAAALAEGAYAPATSSFASFGAAFAGRALTAVRAAVSDTLQKVAVATAAVGTSTGREASTSIHFPRRAYFHAGCTLCGFLGGIASYRGCGSPLQAWEAAVYAAACSSGDVCRRLAAAALVSGTHLYCVT